MNPRTDIAVLKLGGNTSNLQRALKREKADEERPPLTAEQKGEIEKLDALIAQAMKACAKGQTVDGRRNPAFQNLADLVKTRRLIGQGMPAVGKKKPAKELLADVDRLLGRPS